MSRDDDGGREVLLRVKLPGSKEEKVTAYVTLTGDTAVLVKEMEEVEKKPRATLIRELVEEGLEARKVRLQDEGTQT